MKQALRGFRRVDGSVGFRNHILIIPTVTCSAVVCERIAESVEGCVTIPHQHGCSQIGQDAEITYAMLRGMGANPNVGAVVVVSLGCEVVDGMKLSQELAETGKPVEFIRIQDEGGSLKAIHKGIASARRLKTIVESQACEPVNAGAIRIAVKWGDGLRGFSGDQGPFIHAIKTQIRLGSTVIVGEVEKIQRSLGMDRFYAMIQNLVSDPSTLLKSSLKLIDIPEDDIPFLAREEDRLEKDDFYLDLFSDGISAFVPLGEAAVGSGIHLANTPSSDVECLSALAAAGANLAVYFSEEPSPIGSPIMPVIKIGRPECDSIWVDQLDLIYDISDPLRMKEQLLQTIQQVASGRKTASEILGHQEFSIHRVGLSL